VLKSFLLCRFSTSPILFATHIEPVLPVLLSSPRGKYKASLLNNLEDSPEGSRSAELGAEFPASGSAAGEAFDKHSSSPRRVETCELPPTALGRRAFPAIRSRSSVFPVSYLILRLQPPSPYSFTFFFLSQSEPLQCVFPFPVHDREAARLSPPFQSLDNLALFPSGVSPALFGSPPFKPPPSPFSSSWTGRQPLVVLRLFLKGFFVRSFSSCRCI